ncbi:alpha/beta fold hydrolase [Geomicrobium sp. JSM 1781026]
MYAELNGTRLFFDVDGAQFDVVDGELVEKPVCFVVHGGPGGNHVAFKPYLDSLKPYMQLIYIDQRGSGFSDSSDPATYTMEQNVEDLESLRQYLGLGKVWIFGHSYGGMVAQGYSTQYEQHLDGLFLITTAGHGNFMQMAKEIVDDRGSKEHTAYCNKLWAGELNTDEDLQRFYELMGPWYSMKSAEKRPVTYRSKEALNRGFGGFLRDMDYIEALKDVRVPALIIAGQHDWITPPAANEEIAKAMPNGEYRLFENSSHKVMVDEPERFHYEMVSFLERHGQVRAAQSSVAEER